MTFPCVACGGSHESRIRARDDEWLSEALTVFEHVMERCPRTGRWLRIDLRSLLPAGRPPGP